MSGYHGRRGGRSVRSANRSCGTCRSDDQRRRRRSRGRRAHQRPTTSEPSTWSKQVGDLLGILRQPAGLESRGPMKKPRTKTARRPRRLADRSITIASRETLPDKRYDTISGGWQQKSATEHDVRLYEHAPDAFCVSAMLNGDDSYLWI